ncbi:hypothetical protein J3459_015232 [Metarhizium acridum]|uniref:Rossmann-fold NAD(P)(+)-binding protein n=1 Tax=Metarhizium acridum (strain CQMa 102) TaxID=655827 RepID=E9DXI5_METAQ|nr:Rossmann-fold NAD(P)(+)-binding protein [Metarhizium acridum CQMa 102]EFY91743.1 Rossmann-fold NAD(P)(+)-binding protein [Metarhizium acridum CQMa 102]KAG8413666.1 hypothetical protein J3459_015232 [Metarhizium acridum]KAG8414133.1 hypothetical protein J3458_011783 [Metarhizium acridum]
MPTTVIIGGNGKVARHLTRILVAEMQPIHHVHSMIRTTSQIPDIEALGATPVVQSIEAASVSDIAHTLGKIKPDSVVFLASAPFAERDRASSVDRDGAIKCMDACAEAGVKRFIVVSSMDVRDCDKRPVPDWYNEGDVKASARLWGAIEPWMRAKLAADRELRVGNIGRKLDYTIVRPGRLTDGAGVGLVSVGKAHLGNSVSREDVARVVAACLTNRDTIGLAFDVTGGDSPVAPAVARVGADRVDAFEGYY